MKPARASAGKSGRRRFPGISPLAWQHPDDLEATEALKRIPALDVAVKKLSEKWLEKAFLVDSVGSRIRLGPKQAPRIYDSVREACETLDIEVVPQVFLATNGSPNAFAFGMKDYSITLTSALVDLMDEDELLAVIGHELSHIKCEHMLYRTIATILTGVSASVLVGALGIGRIAFLPLQLALLAWARRAELSCDRGGLLVVQDPAKVGSALAKLAGMSRTMIDELDMDEVYKQAAEYEKQFDEELVTKAYKYVKVINSTHPAPVWRAKVISDWAKTDQYARIVAGDYLTRSDAKKRAPERPGSPGDAKKKPKAKCAECGHALEPIFAFCPSCGADVEEARVPCAACGKPVERGWKKCPHCGGRTAA